jgi:uncharacterized protein (DUF1697 family)
MHHYIAFLRGINLGKRRIKMDQLRHLFEEMKLGDVSTFIASGNVLFSSKTSDALKLETAIEQHLERSLGYEVDTFVRTREEVATVAGFLAFSPREFANPGNTVHVGFLSKALSPEQREALLGCGTDVDEFCVDGREFYWLCRIKTNESKVWTLPAMKAVRLPSCSMRNLTTLRKLATQYPVPGA